MGLIEKFLQLSQLISGEIFSVSWGFATVNILSEWSLCKKNVEKVWKKQTKEYVKASLLTR